MTTSARALQVLVNLLGGALPLRLAAPEPAKSWTDGGSGGTWSTLSAGLPGILSAGAITAGAVPVSGGGRASSSVAGLSLLGTNGVSAGAISSFCQMTAAGIDADVDVTALRIGGQTILNPDVNLGLTLPGLADVTVDHRTATWNTTSGDYTYTVRALDLGLLHGGLAIVASGDVVVAESQCTGTVKLGTVSTSRSDLAPGQSGTPVVTITNTGDVAAPNTTVKIPAPPAAYDLGTPSVNTSGTCSTTASPGWITCTGITVPGHGNVRVSLPVQLKASAGSSDDWAPGAGTIDVTSVPVEAVTSASMTVHGGGLLVDAQSRATTGGAVTVVPVTLPAGRTLTAGVEVTNQGPSDAAARITVPIGDRPTGITVDTATVGGTPCTVGPATVVCDPVTVRAGGRVTVDLVVSADIGTPAGTGWDLTGVDAVMNGRTVTGQGRLVTVGTPDVNLAGGVTVTPATAVPGGAAATATIRVANAGALAASPATITVPPPPAGYTVRGATVTGGGTCAVSGSGISCTGVTIPAGQAVTVTVETELAAGVTAGTPWTATAGAPVRATAGGSTGTVTGTIVTPDPRYHLGVTANGPAAATISPGQDGTITVEVRNEGPSDARPATFTVVAPRDTTFGTLPSATAAVCTPHPTRLACSRDLTAGGAAVTLQLPVTVSASADQATPVDGGCVDRGNDGACGPGDADLPSIQLRAPLTARLTTTFAPATITPGTSGDGTLTLRSARAETGVSVTIPTGGLPAGFTAGPATVPGGVCVTGPSAITCTGIDLTANTAKAITVRVTVGPGVVPPESWTPAGIVITSGGETAAATGALAGTGNLDHTLTATVTPPADGTAEPGGSTTMTATITNLGPSAANPAGFRIVAPGGTTFGAAYTGAGGVTCTGGGTAILVCTTALGAGATAGPLTVPLDVAANTGADDPVTGGCVDVDGIPGCGPGDEGIPGFRLRVPLAGRVTVTVDRAEVTPGGDATATVRLGAPRGPLPGVTLTVPDTGRPGDLQVVAVTGGVCTTGPVTCTGLTAPVDVTLTVRAGPLTAPGTTWDALAVEIGESGRAITSAHEIAVVTAADPGLHATLGYTGLTALPGGTGTLTASLTNTGPSAAAGAPVRIVPPAGVTLDALTGATATICTRAPDGGHADCLIDLAVGGAPVALEFPFTIDAGVRPGRAITGGCLDLDGDGTCTAFPSIPVGTPLRQRLSITAAPARIAPGEEADATLTLTSTAQESGLRVTVPLADLPPGTTVTAANLPGAVCTIGADVVCTGTALPVVNTPVTLTLRVDSSSAAAPATWTVTGIEVWKSAAEIAVDAADLAVVGPPTSTLTGAITLPAAGTVAPGTSADIEVTVTNTGPSDAAPAVFTVTAPSGTTFAAVPGGCTGAGTRVATCTITLADGATAGPLIFPVAVPSTADPLHPITGGCLDLDGRAGCGADDETIPGLQLRVPFDRQVTVSVDPVTVVPGRDGDLTVTVTAEQGSLTGLTLTIPLTGLPAGLTVGAADPVSCGVTAAAVTCTGITLATAGAATTVTVTLDAAPGIAPGGHWDATAITVDGTGGTLSVDRRLATVGTADVDLVPAVTPAGPLLPGGQGVIGVTVGNNGDSDADRAGFTVVPPAGTSFGTPLPGDCAVVGGTRNLACAVTVPAHTLPGPALALPIVVDAGAAPGTTLTGGCVDLGNTGQCLVPPDVSLGSIAVAVPFDRQVTVRTSPVVIAPGQTGDATVTVVAAPAQVHTMTVTVPVDGLPAGITVAAPAGCTLTPGDRIECPITAGVATTAVDIPVTVDPAAGTGLVWNVTGIRVDRADGATTGGGGVLVRTGVPGYDLGTSTVAVPAARTVLPGGTATVTITVRNTGAAAATAVPVVLTAPPGVTFAGTPAGCTSLSTTAMSCIVTVAAGGQTGLSADLAVPDPAPADPITGGCLDLGGDGSCDPGDIAFGDIDLRKPLAAVITAGGGTPATVVPGRSGTATIRLDATAARDDLTLTVGADGRPAGVTVTAATLDGTPCAVAGGIVTCTGADLPANGSALLELAVDVAPGAARNATWYPAIRLTEGGDTTVLQRLALTVGTPDTGTGLTVDVAAPTGDVLPGGSTTLWVTMTNPGPSVLAGAHASVRAPSGTTFAPLTRPAADFCVRSSATLVTCVTDLDPEARRFPLTIDIPAPTAPGATIGGGCVDENRDGACGSGDTGIPSFTLAEPFSSRAVLSLSAASVTPGSTGTAVVRVTAARSFSGLTAEIPPGTVPAGLTVVAATGPHGAACTLTGTITCTGVTVPGGVTDLVTLTLRAAPSMPAGTTWTPGTITLTNTAGDVSPAAGVLARIGTPVADLAFTVTMPSGSVAPGGSTTMRVVVTDAGPSDATGTSTRIIAPDGATFGTLTGDAAAACTRIGDDRLSCRATLAVGAPPLIWDLPVRVPANADPDEDLTGGCVDSDRDGTCGATDTGLPTVRLTPTLAQGVTISVPSEAVIRPGRTGTVTVTLAATRARTGLGVTIPLTGLPAGMTVSAAHVLGRPCAVTATEVTCTGVDLPGDGSVDVDLSAAVRSSALPGAGWTPTITVTEGGQSTGRTLNAAVVGAADTALSVAVAVPAAHTLVPGDDADLTVTVVNGGSSLARGVRYTFVAPGGLVFRTPSGVSGVTCTVLAAGARISCLLDVNGDARAEFRLPVTVGEGADVRVPLTGGCADLDTDGDCDGGDEPIPPIQLRLPFGDRVRISGVPVTVTPGSWGTGIVRVTALAPVPDATVTVPLAGLPTGLTITGVTAPAGATCTRDATAITCTGVDLAAGDTHAVHVTTRVDADAPATLTWSPSGVTVTAGQESTTGVAHLISSGGRSSTVTWAVTGAGGTVSPGASRTVTLTATNHGPSAAQGGTASVVAPAGTVFGTLSGPAAQQCRLVTDKLLTCTYDLAADASVSWDVPLTVSGGLSRGDRIEGGCVSADGDDTCGGSGDLPFDPWTVGYLLRDRGSVTVRSTVVAPGRSGTAEIVILADSAFRGLTLTVPLAGLPDGFTVTAAGLGDSPCRIGTAAIACTGADLAAGTPRTLSIGVTVATGTPAGAAWRSTAVTLADPSGDTDVITTAGVLVTTTAAAGDGTVGVTTGPWSEPRPGRGQTTVLPIVLVNDGDTAADPYVLTVVLPDGVTHGTLPSGCTEGGSARIVVCRVRVAPGETVTISLPGVVGGDVAPGQVLTGGCLDRALATDPAGTDPAGTDPAGTDPAGTDPAGTDPACGDADDVPVPDLTAGRFEIDLDVAYLGGTVPAPAGGKLLVELPYGNRGSETADEVAFTVVPPAGVTVDGAEMSVEAGREWVGARAMREPDVVTTECVPLPVVAGNASVCAGPDTAAETGSRLWIALTVGMEAEPGLHAMLVTISASATDGYLLDNTVEVPLRISRDAGDPDDEQPSDDEPEEDLPTTGAQVTGLAVLSTLLVAGGLGVVFLARDETPPARRRPGRHRAGQ